MKLLEGALSSWLALVCRQANERMQLFMGAWVQVAREQASVRRKAVRAGNSLRERASVSSLAAFLKAWAQGTQARLQGAQARKEGALRLWQGAHRKAKGLR